MGTPRDTIQYGYDSDAWGQLLTSYDDSSIVYSLDDGKYPATPFIYGLNGRYELYWEHGNQLRLIVEPVTQYYFNEYTFTYDANGMRTKKEVYHCDDECEQYWTDTYEYTYNGSLLTRMYYHGAAGWWTMDFRYDADGTPISVTFEHVAYEEDWEWGGYLGEETAYDCCAGTYYYVTNLQGDVIALVDESGDLVGTYTYDAWGKLLSTTGSACIMRYNPLRYRGYVYDTETGFYYVSSRYYDPEIGRWINADNQIAGVGGEVLGYNMFAYCMNNPVNRFDVNGNWSLPNWAKVAIGAVATVAAVAVTVATGGAAAPVLIGVAASTIGGAAVSAVNHRVTTGSWEGAGKAALDGAADGFMTGGLCALGGSVVGGAARTIKNAKSGITIGKVGTFEDVAALAKTRHYSGLKEFNFIKKVAGQKAAETVGWWQNKCVVKGVMALKGAIYDCGGALTGAYAKEVALTKGYQYLYNVWLM